MEQATQTVAQRFTAPGPFLETNEKLTPKELGILKLTAPGMTPEEISETLHISYHTVRNHTTNLRRKLRAKNNFTLEPNAQ